MKKDLPNVFANVSGKKFNNVQEEYRTDITEKKEELKKSSESIETKISRIFNSPNHVYKSRVLITTDDGVEEKIIIGRTTNSLLTLSGERIRIFEINDIEEL